MKSALNLEQDALSNMMLLNLLNTNILTSSFHDLYEAGISISQGAPIPTAIIGGLTLIYGAAVALNYMSYAVMKEKILARGKWDLNICCGFTDGGGVNADVFRHSDLPNYVHLDDIYHLPFRTGEFDTILCSHTIEHVDKPVEFFDELQRVGKQVTIVLPPLWDFSAALNILEHRHVFLTMKKEHHSLPPFVKLPLAGWVQKVIGQRMHA